MKGFGWCFRKDNYLNVGLGRLDRYQLSKHATEFVQYLKDARRIPSSLSAELTGHPYLLFGNSKRKVVDDGVLLIGDSAGLASPHSGEGIRPAIESGLLAAQAVMDSKGNYSRIKLASYRKMIDSRFGRGNGDLASSVTRLVPTGLKSILAKKLLASRWFSQHIILDRWFLHENLPALQS
jgi:flavin-dependent dehydrogenase